MGEDVLFCLSLQEGILEIIERGKKQNSTDMKCLTIELHRPKKLQKMLDDDEDRDELAFLYTNIGGIWPAIFL